MNILYIGDVMGEVGLELVERLLPGLRREHDLDLVIAQAENVSDGKGVRVADFRRLQAAGVDFCTGGNWTLHRDEIFAALTDPQEPVIRPANYPTGTPGLGYKFVSSPKGAVLVVSLLGRIVGRDAARTMDNPLKVIDAILGATKGQNHVATIVNFHGDYSSEKVVIGHYLDGKVTAVIGDHWHVPTADARVLPSGTAHQTDVGMCGALNASLGVSLQSVIPRWRDGLRTRNVLETTGQRQFNAVLIESDPKTGLARSIRALRQVI